MWLAIFSLTVLGTLLGLVLGVAAKHFHVEGNSLAAEIEALMPGSNCGQCGFAGCPRAAAAIAEGSAPVTLCPPGGKALAQALAAKLGISIDLDAITDQGPQIASVAEEICIGCCRCSKVCPTDAIVGAAKQMHTVVETLCTGCELCVKPCPVECIVMEPIAENLDNWKWKYPVIEIKRAA